eukprot:gnl/TRDRNA2_/TRDRNA2_203739_c0_seq1.p1 gnl/TRDRNA2_/TRDRNA2_203739_c0~~gnl/TRDRNA2_/TRDRNA2_203739_c0_seq1.p1  ORF type:complete len:219 (-),score=32.20 gnl/TRDRNA2_/TRDRNA2_203739_c0_seq1:129-785(-)
MLLAPSSSSGSGSSSSSQRGVTLLNAASSGSCVVGNGFVVETSDDDERSDPCNKNSSSSKSSDDQNKPKRRHNVSVPAQGTEENPPKVRAERPPPDPGYPTVGSVDHDSGKCRPCLWFPTQVGCYHGARCEKCHFQHPGRAKPSKWKRDNIRKRAAAQAAAKERAAAAEAEAEAAALAREKETAEPGEEAELSDAAAVLLATSEIPAYRQQKPSLLSL